MATAPVRRKSLRFIDANLALEHPPRCNKRASAEFDSWGLFPYIAALPFSRAAGSAGDAQIEDAAMKVRSSLKSLKSRHRDCKLVRRKGVLYVINKTDPRFKAKQG